MGAARVLVVGETVQHYQVLEKIGEGGMGVVYKAIDTRLNRPVAIKVLRPTSDSSRRLQFAWEARAAAGLRHPHIVVIHDIVSDPGADSIIMEYIPGRPLSHVLERGPISIPETIRYGRELASALETAHAAGIVHRDLKPSNILLTPEDSVKLVDFGLARLQHGAPDDQNAILAIAGTCGYMSPEQTQGEPATAKADIFSFGAVLYEMVTGRPAFQGSSPAAVLASVLRDDPLPVETLAPHCPAALAKIIEQCLRKDPRRRFQHMGDVRLALEEVSPVPGRSRWRALARPRALLYSAIGLILLTAQWVIFNRIAEPAANSAPMPLTSFPGEERDAVWSPDGRQIAFTWNGDQQDNYDIYILQPGSSQTLRLTSDPGADDFPAWSPDGRWIAYRHISPDRRSYTLELISPLGGPVRTLFKSTLLGRPNWTPDSKALVIEMPPEPNQPRALWAIYVDSGGRRQLTWPPAGKAEDHQPALSPDGKTLVFARETGWQAAELYLMELMADLSPAGAPRRVTDFGFVSWPAWSPDGRRILFVTDRDGVGIWQIDRSGQRARPVSGSPIGAEGPAVTKRSEGSLSLAFTNAVQEYSIWRYSTESGPGGPAAELVPSSHSQNYARYSNDGKRLAFSSTRSGYQEIWVANADGSQPVQLTSLKHRLTEVGQWSPTDETIAFVSQDRDRQIYMAPSSGGPAVPVTKEEGVQFGTGWSHDGRRYYYDSTRSGRREVWRISRSGGESEQMTANGGRNGFESHQGVFYYWGRETGNTGVLIRRESAGDREVPLDPPGRYDCVSLAPGGFYYQAAGVGGIYLFEEAAGRSIRVLKPPGKPFFQFTISPGGKWFAGSFWGKLTKDLMIMDHFR